MLDVHINSDDHILSDLCNYLGLQQGFEEAQKVWKALALMSTVCICACSHSDKLTFFRFHAAMMPNLLTMTTTLLLTMMNSIGVWVELTWG